MISRKFVLSVMLLLAFVLAACGAATPDAMAHPTEDAMMSHDTPMPEPTQEGMMMHDTPMPDSMTGPNRGCNDGSAGLV